MPTTAKRRFHYKHFFLKTLLLGMSLWQGMALYLHQPLGTLFSYLAIFVIVAVTVVLIAWRQVPKRKWLTAAYITSFVACLAWFFSLTPQHQRQWQADVSQVLDYHQQGNIVTLNNVRNFDWRSETDFTARWETRQYNLKNIKGVNVITSYWMGPAIAHTLVSFDFSDQAPLVFSIEIRKEQHESFSAIGGFFRQYELSLIAADEKDIVYTRSNVRGEQVYFFPIQGLSQMQMQDLFLQYLQQAQQLQQQASWYNTLFSNCTTIVYDMARHVSDYPLPLDWRLLASGYLPNYLHDLKAIDAQWDMQTWYQKAHVNPKTPYEHAWDSASYSAAIRADLPISSAKR